MIQRAVLRGGASMAQCLSDAELEAFVRGTTPERFAEIETHLSQCKSCTARFERLKPSLADLSMHRAPTQVEVTSSAMEITRGSTGVESHWTDNQLQVSRSGDTAISNLSLDEFLAGLSQSGLLPASDIENVRQKTTEDPTNTVAGLVEWLVQEHKLTSYQAEILARGTKGGLVLGNYIILDKLGQGGMGTVFKARHRRMNRLVALKVLPQSLSSIPEAILRFQREVEAAARLHHPNIAAAYDADEASGVHFLVMEHVDGPTLNSLIKQRGALPLSLAVRLMIQAANGLATAHSQGIVHRDIKPGNMMLNKQGVLKLLDMGLAQMRGQEAHLDLTSDVTQTGRVMGTVDYMAPEQARDAKNVDFRADIYSLGCTLFFLATGRAPAPGASAAEKLLWHQCTDPPALSTVVPQSNAVLDDVLARMMAKQPENRQASMEEVAAQLQACLAGLPESDEPILFDGIEYSADHHSATGGSSRAAHVTMHGGLGDTLRAAGAPKLPAPAPPAQQRSFTVWHAASGLAALLLLAITVPLVGRFGFAGKSNVSDAAAASAAAAKLPTPKTPSPHVPYEKLLSVVFQNHGQVTAVTGTGEQLQLRTADALPKQPVEILAVKLDGTGVRDADLGVLAQAPGLREVSLADTRIGDGGLEHLAALRQLTHLNLAKTNVTNGGLAMLGRLADLIELNLERTAISNAGISRILALGKLERLYLSDTAITDAGIEQLQGLKSLRHLALHGTGLTDAQHAALKAANPQLDIAWDGADLERSIAVKLLRKGATLAVIDRTGRRQDGVKTVENLPPGRVIVKDVNLTTGGNFADDELKQLAVLSEIEFVSLGGAGITSDSLAQLHGASTLKSVDLGTLRLSPTAVEALRRALPGCQVLVRDPADVEVAIAVLGAGGRVSVFTERNQLAPDIKDKLQLPAGQFTVRAINLDDVAAVDDSMLARIGELPQLEALFLANTAITDAACSHIAACKALTELGLSGTKVTAAGLATLASLPKLSRLYLAGADLGRDGARRLGEFADLTHLSLRGTKLADDDLASLKRLERLEWLDVSSTPLTDAAQVHLPSLTKLRELNIAETALTDAGREELAAALPKTCRLVADPADAQRLAAKWFVEHAATVSLDSGKLLHAKSLPRGAVHIVSVDLADLSKLSRQEIRDQLEACKELVSLNLSGTKLVEADLALIESMPSLRELRLANLPLTDRTLEQLSGQTALEVLDLSGTFVTGQGLKHLASATGLKQLLLANARTNDVHLVGVTNFAALEVLDVSASAGVSDVGMAAISKLPLLRVLRLRGSRVTDAGLENLTGLKDLEELDLEGTKVTEAGVARLATLGKLRSLSLANTAMSDGVAGTLGPMKTLQYINLTRTRISPETVRQLQTELKNCSIIAPAFVPRDANFGGGFRNGFSPQPPRGP